MHAIYLLACLLARMHSHANVMQLFCWMPFCDTQYNATRVDRVKDLVARSLRAEMHVEV